MRRLWRSCYGSQLQRVAPTIARTSEDCFDLHFNKVPISIRITPQSSTYSYLQSRSADGEAWLSADLSFVTNNEEFRSGDADLLRCVTTGSVALYDWRGDYVLTVEITEPLRVGFSDGGYITNQSAAVGALSISNTLGDMVDVTMSLYNTIILDYCPNSGGRLVGYYDWNGRNISPR